jgi:hypothetical protein
MLDIGKEQAARNDVINVAQSLQAGELVRKTEAEANSVIETKETEEIRRAREQGERHTEGQSEQEGSSKNEKRKSGHPPSFQDPELGRNIDITG